MLKINHVVAFRGDVVVFALLFWLHYMRITIDAHACLTKQ